jgi:hypothetical protein
MQHSSLSQIDVPAGNNDVIQMPDGYDVESVNEMESPLKIAGLATAGWAIGAKIIAQQVSGAVLNGAKAKGVKVSAAPATAACLMLVRLSFWPRFRLC